ncbi:type II secretion system F family protein [Thalassiella azotivora]
MTGILLGGALAGLGLLLLTRALWSPQPQGPAALARLDLQRRRAGRRPTVPQQTAAGGSAGMRRVGERLREVLEDRAITLPSVQADLSVLGKSLEAHLAQSVLTAVMCALLPVFALLMWALGTGGVGSVAPLWLCLLGAVVGALLPTLQIRGEAKERRRDFRHAVGAFLDLVSMNLAGGRGIPEALQAATGISDHWAMRRIRDHLETARLQGVTPWQALGDLGRDTGVEELVDLSAALALVAEDGAKVRESLAARAETLRRKELADLEGAAEERSQSMLVAQLLLCAGFLVFLAYPAVAEVVGL